MIADIRGGAITDSRYATDINYTGDLGRDTFERGNEMWPIIVVP